MRPREGDNLSEGMFPWTNPPAGRTSFGPRMLTRPNDRKLKEDGTVLRKNWRCALPPRLLADQSGARLHFSNRVFVMQAAENRFHEHVRRQAMASF